MKNSELKKYVDLEFEITIFTESVVTTSSGEKVNAFDFSDLFGTTNENNSNTIY